MRSLQEFNLKSIPPHCCDVTSNQEVFREVYELTLQEILLRGGFGCISLKKAGRQTMQCEEIIGKLGRQIKNREKYEEMPVLDRRETEGFFQIPKEDPQ